MMEPDQAQRAVDFVAGGTYAMMATKSAWRKHLPVAPSCVTVTTASSEDLLLA